MKKAGDDADSVDDYLATVPEKERAALEKLRKIIKSVVPEAVEVFSYQIVVVKFKGKPLVGFGAGKSHCSFYIMSSSVIPTHKDRLKSYDTSIGTIRFQAEKPLPVNLVKMLVKARIAENEAREKNN
jgi:uncharacterized protein YdhG (YjbR/CyaY superfamily)